MNVVPNFFWQNKHISFNKLNFGETYETFEKPSLNVFPLDSLQFSKLTFSLTFFDNERNAFLVITNVNGGYVVLYSFATIISVCVCVCVCDERERESVCVCVYVCETQREREKKKKCGCLRVCAFWCLFKLMKISFGNGLSAIPRTQTRGCF